jgi:hypothetical protein
LQYFGISDHYARANPLLFVPEGWIKSHQDYSTAGKFHLLFFRPALARNPADPRASTEVKEVGISFGQAGHPIADSCLSQLFALWVRPAQGATKFLLALSLELILDSPKNELASVSLPSVDVTNDFFWDCDRYTFVHFHTLDMIILFCILNVRNCALV